MVAQQPAVAQPQPEKKKIPTPEDELVKEKAPMGFFDLWFGLFVGGLFITTLIVDLSVIDFGHIAFTAQYLIWKNEAPYLKLLVNIISMTLPLALLGGVASVITIFWQKATFTRHLCDFLSFAALVAVIANTVITVAPGEEETLAFAMRGDVVGLAPLLPQLRMGYIINLALNVAMFILNVVKFGAQLNAAAAPAAEVVVATPEPVKAKKD